MSEKSKSGWIRRRLLGCLSIGLFGMISVLILGIVFLYQLEHRRGRQKLEATMANFASTGVNLAKLKEEAEKPGTPSDLFARVKSEALSKAYPRVPLVNPKREWNFQGFASFTDRKFETLLLNKRRMRRADTKEIIVTGGTFESFFEGLVPSMEKLRLLVDEPGFPDRATGQAARSHARLDQLATLGVLACLETRYRMEREKLPLESIGKQNLTVAFKILAKLESEPYMENFQSRKFLTFFILQTIHHNLHRFSEEELAWLDQKMASLWNPQSLRERYLLQCDKAADEISYFSTKNKVKHWFKMGPEEGWLQQNRARALEFCEEMIVQPLVQRKTPIVGSSARLSGLMSYGRVSEPAISISGRPAYVCLVPEITASTNAIAKREALRLAALDLGSMAIAIQRNHLRDGTYPKTLDKLRFDFPVRNDSSTGNTITYENLGTRFELVRTQDDDRITWRGRKPNAPWLIPHDQE